MIGTYPVFGQKITLNIEQQTPAQILERISSGYGLRFSYASEALSENTIDFEAQDEDLSQVLNRLLKPYRLGFEFIEGNFIAIKPIEDVGVQIDIVIADSLDLGPLSFSTVQVLGTFKGSQADEDGRLRFFVRNPESSVLSISFIGYKPKSISALDLFYSDLDTLYLQPDVISMEGFVIQEYLNAGVVVDIQENSIGVQPGALNVLPGLSEPDALYSLQQIPGISSSTETASNIQIRGGTSDQVSIYWDNIPIYHSAHYFGLISSFIPSSVEDINIYRNTVPIRYGGSASGLISMNSVVEPNQRIHGSADLNMTHFSGSLTVPILSNKVSLYVAGRHSVNDYYESPTFRSYNKKLFDGTRISESVNFAVDEEFDFDNTFNFWDLNTKLNIHLHPKHRIGASLFSGQNTFEFLSVDEELRTADFQFHKVVHSGFNLNWEADVTSNWTSELSFSSSRYELNFEYLLQRQIDGEDVPEKRSFLLASSSDEEEDEEEEGEENEEEEEEDENEEDLEDPNEDDEFFGNRFESAPDSLQDRGSWNNSLLNTEVKWINTLRWNRNTVSFGVQINSMDFSYALREENAFEFDQIRAFSEKGTSYAGFAGLLFPLGGNTIFEGGLRLNQFTFVDVATLDPQVSIRHQFNRIILKSSLSRKHQLVRSLRDFERSISNTTEEIWFIADRESIPLIRNEQVMVGVIFDNRGWLIDVEAYSKRLKGLTSLSYRLSDTDLDDFHTGKEVINGIDILARKRFKKFRTWVSYSFSHARSEYKELRDSEFVSQLDQPHKLSLNLSYSAPRFELSTGWHYKSGLPYSPPSSPVAFRTIVEDDNDTDQEEEVFYEIEYDDINTGRLPDYHRLDVSLWYYFSSRSRSWVGKAGISFQNVYNRSNILNRSFFVDDGDSEGEELSLPIFVEEKQLLGFTPNFTLSISF